MFRNSLPTFAAIATVLSALSIVNAHDLWLEVSSPVVREGDTVQVELKLGNHGNDHRDFKIMGKPRPDELVMEWIDPAGQRTDFRKSLVEQSVGGKDGYFTAKLPAKGVGLHTIFATSDKVVSYAPTRSIKSCKVYFTVSPGLDPVSPGKLSTSPMGHPFELVPMTDPSTALATGAALVVQVFFQGKPAANQRVSFIPRGAQLAESFDPQFERMTDEQGMARYEPQAPDTLLIVAHREDSSHTGEGYTKTKYSATLTVIVPEKRPNLRAAACDCCQ